MGLISFISKGISGRAARKISEWSKNPVATQETVFRKLVHEARDTSFGTDHRFRYINSYEEFKQHVPIRDYEDFAPYIERLKAGEPDVLWKGRPLYLSKTSGTTSGIKYIPISRESIPYHISSTRNALLNYIHETGKSDFLNGKLMFISGSPALENMNGIKVGRLSGIVNHHVPGYLKLNQLPGFRTNCIEDWEEKIDAIIRETKNQNMTFISGIPPWVQMYFDRLMEKTGKKIGELFPNFNLFVYGGVNYEPYREKLENSIGRKIDSVELYPTSEGFIAFQNSQKDKSLLLLLDAGIFYEFIPASEFFNPNPSRVNIQDVELGVNYVIILNTNAGLWGYNLGDTVRFVSKNPYKLLITGRIKHFISAFGEHVIGEEVERAVMEAALEQKVEIVEFTVAPMVSPDGELPYHEWFIEFHRAPANIDQFSRAIDESLQRQNIYYRDLISGNILQPLKLRLLEKNSFIEMMRTEGKLGGQNKVPRLSNDRKIADRLKRFVRESLNERN
ncbi:MAG: hypothetical protein DWQ44_04225 [Bacteroidetes bacterium]|nr:MAG: hypothetical protein DWQ33_11565 [Bacteroidota bacterium]REK00721.1 MAG: hypothetical protein DWQ39_11240 [Bacteroidota bacterium]REK35157.1 MAG: hypothetical protein DWQ44_04225 [Bacteroidota bacterium]REK48234.1 MAG: hypothetical protein DWQ48_10425 [Bacteroidota bacterium]